MGPSSSVREVVRSAGSPVILVVVVVLVMLLAGGVFGVAGDGQQPLNTHADGPDSAGDRLPDAWEQDGETPDGVVLPASDPDRMSLHVRIVYGERMEPLSDEERNDLERIWADLPVENPDGTTGIDLHVEDGGELDERVRLTDPEDRYDVAETYYSPEQMGDAHCVYHLVVLGEVDVNGHAGYANAPGRFSVVDGRYTDNHGGTVSYRVRTITHELLHNVVGTVPEEARGDDDLHTETGWLAHGIDDYADHEHLPEPVADDLSQHGFEPAAGADGEQCG